MSEKKIKPVVFSKLFAGTVFLCLLIIVIIKYDRCKIDMVQIDESKLCDPEGFRLYISQPEMDDYNEWITFQDCWIFKENEDILTFDTELLLCDERGMGYVLIGEYQQRDDFTETFDLDYKIERCGFTCKIPKSKLDFSNNTYKVIIKYNNNSDDLLVDTGYVLKEWGLENEQE